MPILIKGLTWDFFYDKSDMGKIILELKLRCPKGKR